MTKGNDDRSKGNFSAYFYSSPGTIEKAVFNLIENNQCELITSFDKYHGQISFDAGIMYAELINNINNRKAYYIIYVGYGVIPDEIVGVYASLSANGKPVIGRVLLKKDTTDTIPEIIKIHSEEYKKLNFSSYNIGKFLIGKSHNYIKSIRKTNFSHLQNYSDFGEIYFSAASNYAFEGKFNLAANTLEKAFYHGFDDKERISKLKNRYSNIKDITNTINNILLKIS